MFGGAGRNLGAGDGWRGRMNLVMRGWGTEGRSREEMGTEGDEGDQSAGVAWDLRGRKGK